MSYVSFTKCIMENKSINTKKKPTTYLLNFGNQIIIPADICKTPSIFHIMGEILLINEQGGSKNAKNLSAPTIKNRIQQIARRIFFIII